MLESETQAKIIEGLGEEICSFSISEIDKYEKATFPTFQKILGIAYPSSTEEVQKIILLANELNFHVYPISGGKNWGLGSRVPVSTGALILDLKNMDKILDFDSKWGVIRIEPGVSFAQASKYIGEQAGDWFLSVIGGHPDSSVIGNTLERGDGLGPLGDRSLHVCNIEVVLGSGKVINTGFDAFGRTKLQGLTRETLGPFVDGLFIQSNFGIITAMSVWLRERPKPFSLVLFSTKSDREICKVVDAVQPLVAKSIISSNSFTFWNVLKFIASQKQKEDLYNDSKKCLELPPKFKKLKWMGAIPLYSASTLHAKADVRTIKKELKGLNVKSMVLGERSCRFARRFSWLLSKIVKLDVRDLIDTLYFKSVYLGYPTEMSTRSIYWRKKGKLPAMLNPDQDNCGLSWLCHVTPFKSEEVEKLSSIVEAAMISHGFEPNIAFLNTSEKVLRVFIAIVYDREVPGEDEAAVSCHRYIENALTEEGYPAFRLGVQSMNSFKIEDAEYRDFFRDLKNMCDPNGVIAPGRYEFCD